jgi:hypothetical protein
VRRKIGKLVLPPFYIGVGLFVIIGFIYLIIRAIPTMLSEVNIKELCLGVVAVLTMIFGWTALAIFLLTIHFKSKLRKS